MNQITLYAVSADEKVELLEEIGDDRVHFETVPASATAYGEPVTIAVITLSTIAITGLVAYLLKGRKSGRVKIGHMLVTTPIGSMELRDVEIEFQEEKEPSGQLISALQKWLTVAMSGSA